MRYCIVETIRLLEDGLGSDDRNESALDADISRPCRKSNGRVGRRFYRVCCRQNQLYLSLIVGIADMETGAEAVCERLRFSGRHLRKYERGGSFAGIEYVERVHGLRKRCRGVADADLHGRISLCREPGGPILVGIRKAVERIRRERAEDRITAGCGVVRNDPCAL